jgi:hypothetical protein
LKLLPVARGRADIARLRPFVSASEEEHDGVTHQAIIDALAWAKIEAQFMYPCADSPRIAKIP